MMTLMFDDATRVTLTLVDGTTTTVDALSVTVLGKLPRAPAKPKDVKPAKEPPPSRGRNYPVPLVDDETLKAMVHGSEDDPEKLVDAGRQRILEMVCAMRRRFFRLPSLTYNARDAAIFNSLIAAKVLPSQMARAIYVASKDDWWKEQGDLSFPALEKNHAKLAGAYEKTATDPRHVLVALLPKLDAVDSQFATGMRQRLEKATPTEVDDLLTRARARLAAATLPTG